jgi:hypothetical protein
MEKVENNIAKTGGVGMPAPEDAAMMMQAGS